MNEVYKKIRFEEGSSLHPHFINAISVQSGNHTLLLSVQKDTRDIDRYSRFSADSLRILTFGTLCRAGGTGLRIRSGVAKMASDSGRGYISHYESAKHG